MEFEEYLDDIEFICCTEQQTETPLRKKRKKPCVTSSWTYSAINKLILAVEEHPCVWQYSSPEYRDRHKRDQAWTEVAGNFPGHTVEDCKAKWANIKTAFQSVRNKIKTKSGQGAENVQPHWPHWSAMQFYNHHDVSKRQCSVSTLDMEESYPTCNASKISSPAETPSETEKLNKTDILQRAVKCLEADEDNWHAIGMYLASQMREIAKKNKKTANKLHLQLVKSVMEATLEVEEEN